MGLMASGRTWLREQRAGEAVGVTYRRGVLATADVPAVQGATVSKADNGDIIVDSQSVDWLIERADLLLDSAEVEPAAGDRIEATFDHGVESFVVVALGSEPCWRWHGRDGGTFRIHTVRA